MKLLSALSELKAPTFTVTWLQGYGAEPSESNDSETQMKNNTLPKANNPSGQWGDPEGNGKEIQESRVKL